MSRTPTALASLTSLAAAAALLATGCAGRADGVEASGCRDDGGWSAQQQAQWLRSAVSFDEDASGEEAVVEVRPRGTADGRPLCAPVTVQVQFWRLTATASGNELSPALRVQLGTDGSEKRLFGLPPGLSAAERDACTGVLMAVYAGTPLTADELPEGIDRLGGDGVPEVTFRTDRLAAHRLISPPDRERCEADTGAAESATTAPSATSNRWGLDHR
ncbi:hypothetical protein [Streptomyces virginiae]|uniref:hypothetical protein n=1 Tax=Streptomyces virginiae TaxID=1961 RepID=UPI002DDAB0FB|nr:hypothetical protein [Streptomyces virginiae]WSC76145.1 hypothetical protein OHA56_07345 [Streptomyces virginiae]